MTIIETNWKWNGTPAKRSATTHIVLHHAAAKTCTAADVDSWHKANGWSGIGYHYFVRKNGRIYRGRPENTVGAHVIGHNSYSIGICAEGDYSTETVMTEAQKSAIQELIRDIKTRYPNIKVVGHKDLGGSDCPGTYYPLGYFKNYKESGVNTMPKTLNDISGHYAEKHIQKLLDCGIVNGDDNGNYRPNDPITRADAAIIAANVLSYLGK
ncbi:MAG: N-acetylmuramoyl-L-alanine amidase [Oscillospiraceae bacterium]|nr:N-acetylmuramoyl-L-alanine amidase [Oscillospiraceae bacterium]